MSRKGQTVSGLERSGDSKPGVPAWHGRAVGDWDGIGGREVAEVGEKTGLGCDDSAWELGAVAGKGEDIRGIDVQEGTDI